MYLKSIHIKSFRGIPELILNCHKGVNVLIGENNTGKTAILDALRICLSFSAERREIYLTRDDFHVDSYQNTSDTIEFDLTFGDLTKEEQGIFIEMLAMPEAQEPELQLHVRYTYDSVKDSIRLKYWGGENEGQNIPFEVMELLYFIHLGALRDATRDLAPKRGNRLSKLFLKLIDDEDKQNKYAKDINDRIRSSPNWNNLLSHAGTIINQHLEKIALRDSKQTININFVEAEFRKIVGNLKVYIPIKSLTESEENVNSEESNSSHIFDIWQNGLGLNNLIYISTVLGDLLKRREREPNSYISLLIEEPEAHLHPQWQNVLFSYLQQIEKKGIQGNRGQVYTLDRVEERLSGC